MPVNWSWGFSYNEAEIEKRVKEVNGVYLILSKLKETGELRVKYVGRTQEARLKTRLLEHLAEAETNEELKAFLRDYESYIIFAYIEFEEDRKNVEHTLFHHYKPKFNKVEPEGKLIAINLPRLTLEQRAVPLSYPVK